MAIRLHHWIISVAAVVANTMLLLMYAPFGPQIHPSFPGADALRPETTSVLVPAVMSSAYLLFLAATRMACGPISERAGLDKGSKEPSWRAHEDKQVHQRVNKTFAKEGQRAADKAAEELAADLPERTAASVQGRAQAMRAAASRAVLLPEAKIVYNAYQVLMNIGMVSFFLYGVYDMVRASRDTPEGKDLGWVQGVLQLSQPFHVVHGEPKTSGLPGGLAPSGWLRWAFWVHYTNKFVEYADTVFMVAEQRWQQVTFLHTVHHFMMGWVWWTGCTIPAGAAPSFFSGAFNSFVHIVMYTYYLVKAVTQRDVWWKEAVTWLQLVQFVCVFAHAAFYMVTDPEHKIFSSTLTLLAVGTSTFMFFLFSDFFVKTYCKGKRRGKGGSDGPRAQRSGSRANATKPKEQ